MILNEAKQSPSAARYPSKGSTLSLRAQPRLLLLKMILNGAKQSSPTASGAGTAAFDT
jgi:hypothetical protein